ncbi:UDP-2,3-diacylglucosamine diphosphatase [Pseudohongiella sp.]|uniref:Calcineurin-like phosphoesterase domain-containing protein n=1 Tax=marine sediment metagenome TaxID=412755 RepID=A0A0F9W346_9ZZZZ|nr:UDP-2,3-diacylglucosamine diphosphatase [Pseudohongiella sp.]HDZ09084.1 UDP-2,3-diacylglucosamine diphosphatase [Pseudohongiella sp.]HEA63580.1 UDP-2,3-diacylglucosamine diphosphatase [Pseudohongiella sp.]
MSKSPNKTLFISDLHLDTDTPTILQSLLVLLRTRATGADAIYILGDLFEAWVGDDDQSDVADAVADALMTLSQAGAGIYLMHGNRDFLIGQDYAARCGATLLAEPTVIECYGRRVALVHGDSLCTRDSAYMAFRKQMRDPAWQQAFLERPLLERHMVAQQIRQKSQDANSHKASDIMDVTHQEVVKLLETLQVNILIHGHTHRPGIHTIRLHEAINGSDEAVRIVLGSWDQKAWVLEFSPEGYDLKPLAHPEPAAEADPARSAKA